MSRATQDDPPRSLTTVVPDAPQTARPGSPFDPVLASGKHDRDRASVRIANLAPEADAQVQEREAGKDARSSELESPTWSDGKAWKGSIRGPPPTDDRRSSPVVCVQTKGVDGDTRPRRGDPSSDPDEDKLRRWSTERWIYVKDAQRFLSNVPHADLGVVAEHGIRDMLQEHETQNVQVDPTDADVDGEKTQMEESLGAEWLHVEPGVPHYRLVHGVVGRPLSKFKCTKQLVTAVFDALLAHSHAFHSAKLLHRDISIWNILLTDEGRGLLVDWEMAKMMDESGGKQSKRMGTWQFMSANLLLNAGKVHALADDLESFLHVLAWTMFRYLPARGSYDARDRELDMQKFDQGGVRRGAELGSGWYLSSAFTPRLDTPLHGLLKELKKPFMYLYQSSPTEEDRKKVQVRPDSSNSELYLLWHTVVVYDIVTQRLQSPTWFMDTIKKALDDEIWPTDDEGIPDPPRGFKHEEHLIAFGTRQASMERSKSMGRHLKRAASPMLEPSAKRRRRTPTSGV